MMDTNNISQSCSDHACPAGLPTTEDGPTPKIPSPGNFLNLHSSVQGQKHSGSEPPLSSHAKSPRLSGHSVPVAPCRRAAWVWLYLLVVYEHGCLKSACSPLQKTCRLLRRHIDQHALCDEKRWQSLK